MNITGTYDKTARLVRILYDPKAQRAFRQSSTQVANVTKNPLIERLMNERSGETQERLAGGAALLRLLGENEARDVTMHDHQLQAVFVQVMLSASFISASRRHLGALPKALVLLAKVTPYLIPPISLPPAAEVFNQHETSVEVWTTYEAIRSCRPPDKALLPVIHLHALAQALRSMANDDSLRLLVDHLDKVTRMFHTTMGALAARAIINDRTPSSGKRRKS